MVHLFELRKILFASIPLLLVFLINKWYVLTLFTDYYLYNRNMELKFIKQGLDKCTIKRKYKTFTGMLLMTKWKVTYTIWLEWWICYFLLLRNEQKGCKVFSFVCFLILRVYRFNILLSKNMIIEKGKLRNENLTWVCFVNVEIMWIIMLGQWR